MRRGLAAALAVAGLLGACSGANTDPQPIGGDDPTPAETSEPAEPTETEPEPVVEEPEDPFAVPEVIDIEYVQRVFDELFSIETQAYELAIDADVEPGDPVPTEALDPLRTIAADSDYFARLASLLQSSADVGFADLRSPVQDLDFEVRDLLRAEAACIVAAGEVDYTTTAADPSVEQAEHNYVLVPDDGNVTGWAIKRSTALIDGATAYDPDEVCP